MQERSPSVISEDEARRLRFQFSQFSIEELKDRCHRFIGTPYGKFVEQYIDEFYGEKISSPTLRD